MKKILIALFLALLLIVPTLTKADGGIMPMPGYWIAESDQKAVIVFENNTETMILSTTFEGNAKNFAWIVPTPTQPQVDKGPYNIFESLETLTANNNYDGPVYSTGFGGAEMSVPKAVNVIEQKKVDIYDITVLTATDKESLYTWLKDNGYTYPSYGKSVLDSYIQNGWYFSAIKVNQDSLNLAQGELNRGAITPIKLVFSSTKIVYPMKISSITMNNSTVKNPYSYGGIVPENPSRFVSIKLYVFADHKKQAIGFYGDSYANWIDAKDMGNLAFDDKGDSWYTPKTDEMFLTVLTRSMSTADMKDDVFLTDADNNDTYPPSETWAGILAAVLLILAITISPFGLIYIIFMLLFIFIKSRTARIIFIVCQGAWILAGIIVLLLSLALTIGGSSIIGSEFLAILISGLVILVAMIVGIILEIVIGKKKKMFK